jgi:hypothetical protein
VLAATAGSTTLSFSQTEALVVIVGAGMLLAGGVVIIGRKVISGPSDADSGSLIRSWIAISLVLGLLFFCATAFFISDTSLRSTLFGGLIASVGAAVAFYFSSKSADQARADILSAATTLAQGGTPPTGFSANTPQPAATGALYSYQFKANGTPVPQYTLASGSIPTGLILGADGILEGTPAPGSAGNYTFTLKAANSGGSITSDAIALTVTP